MRVPYALFLVCACAVSAAAEDPFPAANALLPQHENSAASGPDFTLDEIEQMALLGNPDIRVAVRHLAVVEAHVPTTGALEAQAALEKSHPQQALADKGYNPI